MTDATLPGLDTVRDTEHALPPVAPVPRANPDDFALTAEAAPLAQFGLFDFRAGTDAAPVSQEQNAMMTDTTTPTVAALREPITPRTRAANDPQTSSDGSIRYEFQPNDKGDPPGKLADAEIHFITGPLAGLKLIGFAIWERKNGGRNVTHPARQYSVNGERRSFALLRPHTDAAAGEDLKDNLIAAYAHFEQQQTRR